MSRTVLATEAVAVPSSAPDRLRRLHLARFAFAVAWAAAFALGGASLDPLGVTLLVLYPAVDVVAAVVDHRSGPVARDRGLLVLNAAVSLVVTLALAVAAASGAPDVLRVWGAWAVGTGLLQLVVALRRRGLGGQWPLIASGALSTLAGAGFVASASGDDPSLAGLAGYATLGGVFFLVSALRSGRVTRR